jgi:hypothetical protein
VRVWPRSCRCGHGRGVGSGGDAGKLFRLIARYRRHDGSQATGRTHEIRRGEKRKKRRSMDAYERLRFYFPTQVCAFVSGGD